LICDTLILTRKPAHNLGNTRHVVQIDEKCRVDLPSTRLTPFLLCHGPYFLPSFIALPTEMYSVPMSLAILPRALGGPFTNRGFGPRASGPPISSSATHGRAYNSELVRLQRFDLAVKSGLPKTCRQNGHQFYHSHPRFATSMSVGREVRYGIHLRLKREVPAAVERCIH
jgi:hypothetical protein